MKIKSIALSQVLFVGFSTDMLLVAQPNNGQSNLIKRAQAKFDEFKEAVKCVWRKKGCDAKERRKSITTGLVVAATAVALVAGGYVLVRSRKSRGSRHRRAEDRGGVAPVGGAVADDLSQGVLEAPPVSEMSTKAAWEEVDSITAELKELNREERQEDTRKAFGGLIGEADAALSELKGRIRQMVVAGKDRGAYNIAAVEAKRLIETAKGLIGAARARVAPPIAISPQIREYAEKLDRLRGAYKRQMYSFATLLDRESVRGLAMGPILDSLEEKTRYLPEGADRINLEELWKAARYSFGMAKFYDSIDEYREFIQKVNRGAELLFNTIERLEK